MRIYWIITTGMVAAAFVSIISCDHISVDDLQNYRLTAYATLRDFMGEAQESLIESPPTNAVGFIQWTKSYTLSTNRTAVKLRSVFDVVWINNNFDAWRDSVKEQRFLLLTAVVGKWQFHGTNGFTGVSFKDEPLDQRGPPDSNFFKLDLTDVKSGPR